MAKEQWPDWEIYVNGKCRCVYCGFEGTKEFLLWQQLVIDQLIPKSGGGDDSPGNKVVACVRCNTVKRHYQPRGEPELWPTPPDTKVRDRLIQSARTWIERSKPEAESDFHCMILEILSGKPTELSREPLGRSSRLSVDNLEGPSLFDIMETCERQVILDMLERTGWSQTEAAERFKIPLSTLNQKIKRLGIDVSSHRFQLHDD